MIQLQDLTKTFGDRVLLDHVTWQIDDRERVGLCGANGVGKTTLLRMMAGLEEIDSGAVLKPATLTSGYLPQDGLTHKGRTVFEEATSAFATASRTDVGWAPVPTWRPRRSSPRWKQPTSQPVTR